MAKNRTMQAKNAKVRKCDLARRKERATVNIIVEGIGHAEYCAYQIKKYDRHSVIKHEYVVGNRNGKFNMMSTNEYNIGDKVIYKGKASYVKVVIS